MSVIENVLFRDAKIQYAKTMKQVKVKQKKLSQTSKLSAQISKITSNRDFISILITLLSVTIIKITLIIFVAILLADSTTKTVSYYACEKIMPYSYMYDIGNLINHFPSPLTLLIRFSNSSVHLIVSTKWYVSIKINLKNVILFLEMMFSA